VVTRLTLRPLQPAQPGANDTFAQNGQDRKLAFVNASVDTRTTSPDRVAAPASTYVVQAGNTIPAALITGIRSDLPGQITAQVTENIFDSPTGRFLLISQLLRNGDLDCGNPLPPARKMPVTHAMERSI
jgi:type IV secretion system protein VirB10